MRPSTALLSATLLMSVAVNGWLAWQLVNNRTVLTESSPSAFGRTDTAPEQDSGLPPASPALATSPASRLTASAPMALENEIKSLQSQLKQGELTDLAERVSALLRTHPDNVELLLLEADLIARTQPLSEAVIHYYGLLDLALPDPVRREIVETISTLSDNAIEQLRADQTWDLLAQFLEPLFQLLPQHRGYILALAEAYGQQQKITLMEDVLASLPANDYQAVAIREKALDSLVSDQDQTTAIGPPPETTIEPDMHPVPLLRVGDQFIAQTLIGKRRTTLLLDTGASTTAISSQVFEQIKSTQRVHFIGVFDVNTAGGKIRAPLIQLPVLTLGPFKFTDLSVLVMPVGEMRQAEGLLGMNILKSFDFRIDQQSDRLLLRRL